MPAPKKGKKAKHTSKSLLTDTDIEDEIPLGSAEKAASRLLTSAEKAASRAETIAMAEKIQAKNHPIIPNSAPAAAPPPATPVAPVSPVAPSLSPTAPADTLPSTEKIAAARAQAIHKAKQSCRLGYGKLPLYVAPDAAKLRPTLRTRQENNREAPDAEVRKFIEKCEAKVGGVDRENWRFALTLLVDPSYIDNLDEIKAWAPLSDDPMVDIEWTAEATILKFMELLNGFHRFRAVYLQLEAKFKRLLLLRQWTIGYRAKEPKSDKDNAHALKSKQERSNLWESIMDNSTFTVELYDEGKFFHFSHLRWRENPLADVLPQFLQ